MGIHSTLAQYPFLLGLLSFIVGAVLMPYIVSTAKKNKLIARPNTRTSHKGNVPNIGGLAIFFAFIITYFLFSMYNLDFKEKFIVVGMCVIWLVGFYDDMAEFSSNTKFVGELFVGLLLIVGAGVRFTHLHGFLGVGEMADWGSYLLSFFVYLFIINAINLIDGVDGLAAGLGIVICMTFSVYFQWAGAIPLSMMAYALVGSLVIFFIYNVFGGKKKIFMGDSGSLLIGYIIYIFVVKFCEMNAYDELGSSTFLLMKAAPVFALCVLAVPLSDVIRVVITRLKQGKSPFKADKNHVHHLLLSCKFSHKQVTFLLMGVNVGFIVLGWLIRNLKIEVAFLIFLIIVCVLFFSLWRAVDYHAGHHVDRKN
ncbi:MAG: undecaprenyl/decaprenyl-phosphate alpha-N-acetylglucosaminyl 1-phosphate transferase [Candidatus Symbiothrix sp.]|jgi:UDP-N-acetylmuramyl pentapeptide phosphotransferase/UDP-N-acetylglucosamine-1-phosphate transferase|nr:undecaprenyl/decaprenyl-phosphate alpha-N-acetylglucosaminyl 1-phosphate transferase [Candidatus Symbiothrix sp.]